jgi:hypothetical protein
MLLKIIIILLGIVKQHVRFMIILGMKDIIQYKKRSLHPLKRPLWAFAFALFSQ